MPSNPTPSRAGEALCEHCQIDPCICEAAYRGFYGLPAASPRTLTRQRNAMKTDRAAAFHAHLDRCTKCRDHPLALCPKGAELLKQAVTL